ncbi:MAG: carboxylate--amine ligase [Sphingomonadaceae bacterium]
MTRHPVAIILGVDTPIGLTVVRELGRHGVPVHGIGNSAGSIGAASRFCASFSQRPRGQELAQWLPGIIAKTGAAALLAVSENDLVALAALPGIIGECRILTPRAAMLDLVLDKRKTLAHAAALGIDTPASWSPSRGDDFETHILTLTYPVILKWPDPTRVMAGLDRHGIAFQKAEFASDPGALMAILDRYQPLGEWPLVQGYCPGAGLGQMLFMSGGRATLRFQHRRLHEWPPEGGVSTLCRAEPLARHVDQMHQSEALLCAIGWEGPAMVEYRHDPQTGRYWLMEINGRFWGSLPLAWHCGAYFAWESYRRAILGHTELPALPRSDLHARYMIPETRRLIRIVAGRQAIADPYFKTRPWRDIVSYVMGFFDPNMRYYVFSWGDPKPFLVDLASVIRKALRLEKR